MKIDLLDYILKDIGDTDWWGETNHDHKSSENLSKLDTYLTELENIREELEERVSDFEKLGLGMFAHWGLYSQLGVGEWTFHLDKRDMNEYKKLADSFPAEDFDADEFVFTAKNNVFLVVFSV